MKPMGGFSSKPPRVPTEAVMSGFSFTWNLRFGLAFSERHDCPRPCRAKASVVRTIGALFFRLNVITYAHMMFRCGDQVG